MILLSRGRACCADATVAEAVAMTNDNSGSSSNIIIIVVVVVAGSSLTQNQCSV
jgi:hypothetical protein